ncbi:MAG: hypothetical protein EOP48_03450 [Sphingobacteriales bacterium]|nr:MAG: hypothetical protein EOP48_03450 [Sphingobacteriales bacterium]
MIATIIHGFDLLIREELLTRTGGLEDYNNSVALSTSKFRTTSQLTRYSGKISEICHSKLAIGKQIRLYDFEAA